LTNIRANVIFFSRDKPHKPNQSKPHWFGLDDFFKNQPNQTKPHVFLSHGLDDFYAQNRTKPHREHPLDEGN